MHTAKIAIADTTTTTTIANASGKVILYCCWTGINWEAACARYHGLPLILLQWLQKLLYTLLTTGIRIIYLRVEDGVSNTERPNNVKNTVNNSRKQILCIYLLIYRHTYGWATTKKLSAFICHEKNNDCQEVLTATAQPTHGESSRTLPQ